MTREEAIKWLKIKRECYDYEGMSCEKPMDAGLEIGCGYCEEALDMAIEALSEPIVRCKDCVWHYEHECRYCGRRIPTEDVGFCDHGEREND